MTVLLSPQRNRVETHPYSHTQSCRDALAWRWGTSCCMYAPQVTSQAAERQPSPCCATAVGSGMAWHRPVGKVSVPSRASLVHLGPVEESVCPELSLESVKCLAVSSAPPLRPPTCLGGPYWTLENRTEVRPRLMRGRQMPCTTAPAPYFLGWAMVFSLCGVCHTQLFPHHLTHILGVKHCFPWSISLSLAHSGGVYLL